MSESWEGSTEKSNEDWNTGNIEQPNVEEWQAEIIDLTSFPGNKSGWETESEGLPPVVADATAPESGQHVVQAGSEKLVAALDSEASELLASEPQNHCIPVFEVIEIPKDESIIVLVFPNFLPLLDVKFETRDDSMEFLRQIFEELYGCANVQTAQDASVDW
ncbi:hypothetical protein BU17DRAFT_66934 [Hysterangium stoloniferum]|nr:hypothetical protein BU17DRAFT_66934 [Hysterangium stoloniferum]